MKFDLDFDFSLLRIEPRYNLRVFVAMFFKFSVLLPRL